MKKKSYSLSESLLVSLTGYPVLALILSEIALLLGYKISVVINPMAATLSLAFGAWLYRGRCVDLMLRFIAIIAFSIVASSIWFLSIHTDGDTCHRGAMMLIDVGWNPLLEPRLEVVQEKIGQLFQKPWHTAFLPKGAWLFGATLYSIFGYAEIEDVINWLSISSAAICVYRFLSLNFNFNRRVRIVLTMISVCPPVVASYMVGGMYDPAVYGFIVMALLSADDFFRTRQIKMLPVFVFSLALVTSIKHTGFLIWIASFVCYAIAIAMDYGRRWNVSELRYGLRRDLKVWSFTFVVSGFMILASNISPYVTNSVVYGGPFYPAHTFKASEKVSEDPMTHDFSEGNADSKRMSGIARFASAYISKDAVNWCYRLKNKDFNPYFHVSAGMDGFGPIFKVFFVVSIFAWLFLVRNKPVSVLASFLLLQTLLMPTYYQGYARYVSQFYLFPIVIAVGVMQNLKSRCLRNCVMMAGCAYWIALIASPITLVAMEWMISVQNLMIYDAIRKSNVAFLDARTFHTSLDFTRDLGLEDKIKLLDGSEDVSALFNSYSYFHFFDVYTDVPIDGFYDLSHVISHGDGSVRSGRAAKNAKFFLNRFLIPETIGLPSRLAAIIKIRWEQIRRRCYGQ